MSASKRVAYSPDADLEAAASLAARAGLPETTRACMRLIGRAPPDTKFSEIAPDVLNLIDTLDHETPSYRDPLVSDAYNRARSLVQVARNARSPLALGAALFEGVETWNRSARHFEDAVAAVDGRSSAAKRARSTLGLVRFMWLVETVVKPLEARAFGELHRALSDSGAAGPKSAFLSEIHKFMEVRRRYPIRLRGTRWTYLCADTMLLRNSIAHARVEFRPDGGVVADLFDRETEASVGTLRLTGRQLDECFEVVELRVRFFVFLVLLHRALALLVPPRSKAVVRLLYEWESKGQITRQP